MKRLLLVVAALATGFVLGFGLGGARPPSPTAVPAVERQRLPGYERVRPLVECRFGTDRGSYATLRGELNALVAQARADARLGAIAIDVHDLESGRELVIDADLKFTPASLFKLPTVLGILRMAEQDPALLDREVEFQPTPSDLRQEVPVATPLVPGRRYTVRHLVEQAIIQSDNDAAALLHEVSTVDRFLGTFSELGLRPPALGVNDDFYSVREYAAFFRSLFNAGYLGPEMSEWVLGLLSRTRFRDGLVAGVPDTVEVAHKFGERRSDVHLPGMRQQLHDCGIVYFPARPYLLCVMTRGESIPELASVIRDVSATVYRFHQRDTQPTALTQAGGW